MRKFDFIETLAEKAGITNEQAAMVNEILESHHVIGRNSKLAVIDEITEKLGVDRTVAENISDTASGIIAHGIKERIKHPFGSDKK